VEDRGDGRLGQRSAARYAPGHRDGIAEHWHAASSSLDAAPDRRDGTAEHWHVVSCFLDAEDIRAGSVRADVAEHGQRPLLSDVITEATSGRFDTWLYDLPSPLALSKREEEEEADAAVTCQKGSPGTLKTWMTSLSLPSWNGP
jgi:hypothetical protein